MTTAQQYAQVRYLETLASLGGFSSIDDLAREDRDQFEEAAADWRQSMEWNSEDDWRWACGWLI